MSVIFAFSIYCYLSLNANIFFKTLWCICHKNLCLRLLSVCYNRTKPVLLLVFVNTFTFKSYKQYPICLFSCSKNSQFACFPARKFLIWLVQDLFPTGWKKCCIQLVKKWIRKKSAGPTNKDYGFQNNKKALQWPGTMRPISLWTAWPKPVAHFYWTTMIWKSEALFLTAMIWNF